MFMRAKTVKTLHKCDFSFFRASGGLRFHYSNLLGCSEPATYVSSKASLHAESGNSMIGPDDDEIGAKTVQNQYKKVDFRFFELLAVSVSIILTF